MQGVRTVGRLLAIGVGGVLSTALVLGGVGVQQGDAFGARARQQVDHLIDRDLTRAALDAAHLVEAQGRAVQQKVDSDLNVARHVLRTHGPISFGPEVQGGEAVNQFSGERRPVSLPVMRVGDVELRRNSDPRRPTPIIDEVERLVGGTATIFQRLNSDGDLLRVATNVRTSEGTRAVGTFIPARNPDGRPNPVAETVTAGGTYRGVAFAVNDWYVTAYEPIRDGDGHVVGALYVGVKQDNLDVLRAALQDQPSDQKAVVSILRGSGPDRGRPVFSPGRPDSPGAGHPDRDADGQPYSEQIVTSATGLGPGDVASGRYTWLQDGQRVPVLTRAVYYRPWDWVVVLEAPEAEYSAVQATIAQGQHNMAATLVLVGFALVLIGGGAAAMSTRRFARMQTELAYQARHDPLTGLANRVLFAELVDQARQQGGQLAVLFVDLDDFKTVNDSLGHAAGDELLVRIADRLRSCLVRGEQVARLGGDEFAVLLPEGGGETAARTTASRILACLRAPVPVAGRDLVVRASIGIACGLEDPGALLAAADAALYAAKSAGKGRYETFHPRMLTAVAERLELRADMQHAVEHGEFLLHYQPTVDLDTGRVRGVEALLRWQHPRRGLVPPGEFVPLAEETGLIVPVGRWVLREACRQAQEWRRLDPGRDLTVAVNVSGVQLHHPRCLADVADALADSGLDPAALVLEITESVLMAEGVAETLAQLKALGVRLALDDFGTGYSSLSSLRHFPVELLKLDRSFVDGVEGGDERLLLVKGIVGLGQSLRLELVAEGIETAAQLEVLLDLHCPLGQGFYFSPPLPPAALGRLLANGGLLRPQAADPHALVPAPRAS